MEGSVFCVIGRTVENGYLKVKGLDSGTVIEEKLETLKNAWKQTLNW